MKISEAIVQADTMRPNAISEELKVKWLYELDCEVAEMCEADKPEYDWPVEDTETVLSAPQDGIYPKYLMAQIDYYNQESAMYENDMTIFNAAYDDVMAWWRRNHMKESKGGWKVM